jgi:dipeptidyl aminopeptidase/acylaminoacyl peptidase
MFDVLLQLVTGALARAGRSGHHYLMNPKVRRAALGGLLAALPAAAETGYRLPPREVVKIIDAPPPPAVVVSPRRDALLLISYEAHPPIALLARPFHRLAGLRVDPVRGARQRTFRYTGIAVRRLDEKTARTVTLPASASVGIPVWSNDGTRFAFSVDREDGVELWVGDVATARAARVEDVRLNDLLGQPFEWMNDSARLLVRLVPGGRGAPPQAPVVPGGPIVEETSGKVSKMATFQDLLKSPHDEALFEHFGRTQLAVVDSRSGVISPLGKPDLYLGPGLSRDEKYLLVTRLRRPFSYHVPFPLFSRTIEVLDAARGTPVRVIAELPVSEEVPTQGVPTGPRQLDWQPLHSARLVWTEALDGGDPLRKVPHREALMTLEAPFQAPPRQIVKLQHRYAGIDWTARPDQALVSEYDRDRRWTTTALVDLTRPQESRTVLFDRSVNDAYGDPGDPIQQLRPNGDRVLLQDDDSIYLVGRGASPSGERPFIDRLNLATREKQRLYQSDDKSVTTVLGFVGDGRDRLLVRHESKSEPPNLYLQVVATGKRTAITAYRDPAPELTAAAAGKQLLKYSRPDGTQLSGMLYLPPGHRKGTRLPVLLWAYPLEYSDPATAGQVRGSPNSFTFFRGPSPLFFLTQGYAVLMDATMPVVGDPERMNDTFVEQVVAAAKAAIDKLVEIGVADRDRVLVAGHSYGAFMTANLLAHSDLFAAGIARSGAYNRSLTPFGFQSERRSFWEAPEVYMKVSPFTHADKINEPLLLIHGQADNNSGTHTVQSERFYEALKGSGATVRLVLLPHESHGYLARESVLHTLAEMLDWGNRYVKNRPPKGVVTKAAAPGPGI